MSDKFVEKFTVCEDLIKSLKKKDTTSAVLYDMIGRDSSCDYTQQLEDGLQEGAPLYTYIKDNFESNVTTKLPMARRIYLNTDDMAANTANVIVGMSTQRVLPFAYTRDLVTSRKMIEYTAGQINESSLHNGGNYTVGFDFTFTVFDGVHAPGATHAAPTWTTPKLNLDNKEANYLQVDLFYAAFNPGTPSDNTGNITRRRYLFRAIMHPRDIIEQKMMRMSGFFGIPMSYSIQLEVKPTIVGSPFNYDGNLPMIGFFKQNNASAVGDPVPTDTSNFIDFIETSHRY